MKTYILLLFITLCAYLPASASEEHEKDGSEISSEHKSDQGLEHGNAYAGENDKKDPEKKLKEEGGKKSDKEKDKSKSKKKEK